mgnify:CR=1 FL=1
MGEIFGETSILLNVPRTVTAKVCAQKLVAKKIPKSYFTKMIKSNVVLSALIRKTQIRLIDSNKQSNELANSLLCLFESISLICVFLINALKTTLDLIIFVKYDLGIFLATNF